MLPMLLFHSITVYVIPGVKDFLITSFPQLTFSNLPTNTIRDMALEDTDSCGPRPPHAKRRSRQSLKVSDNHSTVI